MRNWMKAGSGMPISFFSLTWTWSRNVHLHLARNKNKVFASVISTLILALHGLQDACKIKFFSIYPASINCSTAPNLCSQFAFVSHNWHRMNHETPTPVGTSFHSNSMSLYSNKVLSATWSHFITLCNDMKLVGAFILPEDLGRNEISWPQLSA